MSTAPPPAVQSAPKSLFWWLIRFGFIGAFFLAGILLIVALGVAQRIGWIQSEGAATATGDRQAETYTCPMHPQIRQPGPGRCPICGMALVPATSEGTDLEKFAVRIEPAQRRLANIQTAEATIQPVSTSIHTIGSIEIDESRQATIASYVAGRVEKMFADYTGVQVAKGDHLAIVYSPELYGAQVEYLQARSSLTNMTGGALAAVREAQQKLAENARHKLVELGMTEAQIQELEEANQAKSRLTVYSPIGGTVIEKLAENGKYISAGEPLYRIANLSTVWLMLELYPEDASRIRFGQQVKAELNSHPGRELIGRIAFINPTVSQKNRTVGVRVEFSNEDGLLRPGDYADAEIEIPIGPQGEVYDAQLAGKWISPMHPQVIRDQPGACPICGMDLVPTSQYGYADAPVPRQQSVTVPRSAVLLAGEHSVVYVEKEPGLFELRNVKLGTILRDRAIVLSGVKPGEQVATAGNFLIDSQMQLAGKPSLIDPTRHERKEEKYRNTPLEFEQIQIAKVPGDTGVKLEQLYQHYFAIQQALADDKKPEASNAVSLHDLAVDLGQAEALSSAVHDQLKAVAENSAHLHHVSLDQARKKFKPISHAIVTLATEVRGEQAESTFRHFFCPMVKQGEGDWLQSEALLSNPYYGSQMLRCGDLVHELPPTAGDGKSDDQSPKESRPDVPSTGGN